MHKWTQLDAVLNYVSKNIRKEEGDLQVKSWALQAYRMLKIPKQRVQEPVFLEVKNNQADLPKDLLYISSVSWMCKMPSDEDQLDLLCKTTSKCGNCDIDIECNSPGTYKTDRGIACSSCDTCVTGPALFVTRTNNICRHTLAYQLMLDSNFFRENFVTLRYKGQKNPMINKSCYRANCDQGYSISPGQGKINLDMKEGVIMLTYSKEVSKDGKTVVPDDPILLRGLAMYVEAQHYSNRVPNAETNYFQIYTYKMTEFKNLLRRYKGQSILENLDLQQLETVIGTSTNAQRLLRHWKESSKPYHL